MEEGRFEIIVDALYDAATEPASWPAALAAVGDFFGGVGAQFMLQNARTGEIPFSRVGGSFKVEAETDYVEYYSTIDPRRNCWERLPIGTIGVCHRWCPEDFVRCSEFYNDFLIPAGGRYLAVGRLLQVGRLTALVGIHRNLRQGPFEAGDVASIERLVPHLQRAVRLHCEFEHLRLQNVAFDEALDQAPTGIILADRHGRCLYFNRAAEDIVRRQDGLSVRHGALTAMVHADAMALRRLIVAAADTAAGRAVHGGGAMRVARGGDKLPHEVLVAPLPRRHADLAPDQRVAIVFVRRPERPRRAAVEQFAAAFRLTPAEMRLAAGLVAGKSLRDYADETGLSINTVRWTLKQIFAKTETRRQPAAGDHSFVAGRCASRRRYRARPGLKPDRCRSLSTKMHAAPPKWVVRRPDAWAK